MKKFLRKKAKQAFTLSKKTSKRLRKHPFLLPVVGLFFGLIAFTALFLSLNATTIGPTDSHVVHITIEGKTRSIPSRAPTVADLLVKLKIDLAEQDLVEPALDTPIVEDGVAVSVFRAKPVVIVDNGKRTEVLSAQPTPRLIAEKAGISLYPEDKVELTALEPTLQDRSIAQKVLIDRAKPIVLNLYGAPIMTRTHSKTVKDLLAEKSVLLAEGDTVQPGIDEPLAPETPVFVVRLGKQILNTEEQIAFQVETQDDPASALGATKIITAGVTGKKLVTYELELKNGQEVSRKKIQEVVQLEPVKQVVSRGTKLLTSIGGSATDWMVAAGIPASDYGHVDYIISRESGWCPTKWQGTHACPGYYQELHSPSSGYGYGLCQSTPAIKMATAGSDWQVNPVTQLKWCGNYANKYGGWQGAYNFWVVNHWW